MAPFDAGPIGGIPATAATRTLIKRLAVAAAVAIVIAPPAPRLGRIIGTRHRRRAARHEQISARTRALAIGVPRPRILAKVQRRKADLIRRIDSGTRVEQQAHHVRSARLTGGVERGAALGRRVADACATSEECLHALAVAFLRCHVQGGRPIVGDHLDICPCVEENLDNLGVAIFRCECKR